MFRILEWWEIRPFFWFIKVWKNALTQAQQAVQSCGFIGGGQAESLVNALGVVKSKIDAATGEISNETKSYMDQTIAEYSNTEGKVSEAFSANN